MVDVITKTHKIISKLCIVAFLYPCLLLGENSEIVSFKDREISLSLAKEDTPVKKNILLKINTNKLTESTVFSIENPNRIVIDLIGPTVKKNRNLDLPKGMQFNTIRVGSHPDKVRIVIDVNNDKIPSYRWKTHGNEAVLAISSENNVSPVAPIVKPTSIPTIQIKQDIPSQNPVPEVNKEDEIEDIINRNPKPLPSVSPAIDNNVDSSLAPLPATEATTEILVLSGPILSNIEFAYSDDATPKPIIKLILGERSQFQLERVNEKTYSITLSGFRLGKKSLSLAQFPPHDFLGFTLISAEEKREGLVVTVGVEQDTRIQAAPNGEQIWITNITENKLNSSPPPQTGKSKKSVVPPLRSR